MHGWQNDVSLVKIRISRKATDIHKLQENKAKLLKARQKEGVRVSMDIFVYVHIGYIEM